MWRLFLFAFIIGSVLFAVLKLTPKKHHRLIFIVSSLIPIVFIIIRLIYRAVSIGNVAYTLQAIPFTLCGMSSILIVIVSFTRSKVAYNINYYISMPATVFAVLLDNTVTTEGWSVNFWCFLIPHLFYLFMPLYMLLFKYMRPDIKKIPRTVLTLAIVIVLMHGLNSLLSWTLPTDNGFPTTNFIFTMFPGDNNGPPLFEYKYFPLLKDAWAILPVQLVYLLLLSPILAVLLLLLSLPLISKEGYKKFGGKISKSYKRIFKKEKAKDGVQDESTQACETAEPGENKQNDAD